MLVNEQHADDDIAFKDMFSYKMNHAGWRYQVSLAIQSGYIVHVNNGTAPGVLNDLNAVRMSDLPALLRKNKEKACADDGYRGEPDILTTPDAGFSSKFRRQMKNARARHENVNARFKNWKVMKHQFRHPLHFHTICFHAVVVLTQLDIEHGSPLSQVQFHLEGNELDRDLDGTVEDDGSEEEGSDESDDEDDEDDGSEDDYDDDGSEDDGSDGSDGGDDDDDNDSDSGDDDMASIDDDDDSDNDDNYFDN